MVFSHAFRAPCFFLLAVYAAPRNFLLRSRRRPYRQVVSVPSTTIPTWIAFLILPERTQAAASIVMNELFGTSLVMHLFSAIQLAYR